MRVALFGKHVADTVVPKIQELVGRLQQVDGNLIMFRSLYESLLDKISFNYVPQLFDMERGLPEKIDFLFSIGGDGTILDAVSLVGDSEIPVIGINLGRLGFLSSISKDQILPALDAIEKGLYTLEKRTLLQLVSPQHLFGTNLWALNDVTVYKPNVMSMLTIKTWINGEFLNSYWADGLIVATPTGSTAYSLSCTGPIITPDAENFLITPIASHNLTVRPIVIRDDCEIRIQVGGKGNNYLVSLDSRTEKVDNSVELIIRKAEFKIHLLRLNEKNFFQTIREKLNWGLDNRN
ncbi:MAG: NAD kinase [Bacteroidales bacterium]|nr:NAD kinase [Bacteroidales bacterium]MDD4602972.1 NAD kinase [Bacteroidales bacterium]